MRWGGSHTHSFTSHTHHISPPPPCSPVSGINTSHLCQFFLYRITHGFHTCPPSICLWQFFIILFDASKSQIQTHILYLHLAALPPHTHIKASFVSHLVHLCCFFYLLCIE